MTSADPKAVWLMQGWLFQTSWWKNKQPQIEAYLSGMYLMYYQYSWLIP